MAAGLSHRRKYDIVRGALMRLERWAITLPEVTGTYRQGGSHLVIHREEKPCLPLLVQFHWIHASNGECFALLSLNGKRQVIGCVKDRIQEALSE